MISRWNGTNKIKLKLSYRKTKNYSSLCRNQPEPYSLEPSGGWAWAAGGLTGKMVRSGTGNAVTVVGPNLKTRVVLA